MNDLRQVAVCLEHRFYRVGGRVYTKLSFPYRYWCDYLAYFHKVIVVARVKEVDFVEVDFQEVTGPGVDVLDFPYYIGPLDMLKKLPRVLQQAYRVAKRFDRFLLRSGNVSNFVWFFLMLYRKKYIREFPGNVKEGVVGVVGKRFYSVFLASFLDYISKLQGKYSCANSFVSEYCEKLYGSTRPGYVFSSFQVEEVVNRKASYAIAGKEPIIVAVGRLEGEKGHADLIHSLALLSQNEISVSLYLIGDGRQRSLLESMCKEKGVSCKFFGGITDRDLLFKTILQADLFVIPSHTEGMPRALLEAMAMGMPCIGTNVGGIPEVLSSDALVESLSPNCLADRIRAFLEDEGTRRVQGTANFELVHSKFGKDVLREKKVAFWERLYE